MSSQQNDGNLGKTIDGGRYKLTQRLGSGSFGEIYKAVDTSNEGKEFAVKLEKTTEKSAQLKSGTYPLEFLGLAFHLTPTTT